RRLKQLGDESQALAASRMSPGELAHALQKMLKALDAQRDALVREATEPLEHLAVVFPLLEDAARFAILYERQKGLAERLASLKGRDRPEEAALKKRMRDLQAEQQELQADLARLLTDIEE